MKGEKNDGSLQRELAGFFCCFFFRPIRLLIFFVSTKLWTL